MLKRLRHRLARKVDTLRIESCPLHTEEAKFAAQAPSQVDAACKRGADVIGFTEVHTALAHELASVCAKNGYKFFHKDGDTAIAWKATLDETEVGNGTGVGVRVPSFVTFDFHGSLVTVFAYHWATTKSDPHNLIRSKQTAQVANDMATASAGKRLSFLVADSNPDKPVKDPTSQPRAGLAKAGILLAWADLDSFPAGVGVTTIARNSADTRVTTKAATLSPALGSDHQPGSVSYAVKRPLHH
jgi:hypothetical protein